MGVDSAGKTHGPGDESVWSDSKAGCRECVELRPDCRCEGILGDVKGGEGTSREVSSESVSAGRYTHLGTLIASSHHPAPAFFSIPFVAIVRVFPAPLLCMSPLPLSIEDLATKKERWGYRHPTEQGRTRTPSLSTPIQRHRLASTNGPPPPPAVSSHGPIPAPPIHSRRDHPRSSTQARAVERAPIARAATRDASLATRRGP